jgi:hypothetical protein
LETLDQWWLKSNGDVAASRDVASVIVSRASRAQLSLFKQVEQTWRRESRKQLQLGLFKVGFL